VGLSYYSRSDIISKIQDYETAISTVLSGGKSYRLNDGQGDIQVTRESLTTLENHRKYWESRLNDLEMEADNSGIVSFEVHR
jgi:hypothetical protein